MTERATDNYESGGSQEGPDFFIQTPQENEGVGELSPRRRLVEAELRRAKEKLSKAIIHDISSFDLWLRQTKGPLEFIVGYYITKPDSGIEPIPQEESLPRLRGHRQTMAQIGLENLPPEFTLIDARLGSIDTYFEEQEKLKRGEPKTILTDYAQAVDLFTPRLIPQKDIDDIREEEILGGLRRLGYAFTPNSEQSVRMALAVYHKGNQLKSKESIEYNYWRSAKRYRHQLSQAIGQELSSVKYDIVWKDADAFWKGYERVEEGGNYLWLNENERHMGEYDHAIVETYALHEDLHMAQASLIASEIRGRRLDPAVGIVPSIGPDAYLLEGLAQTVGDLAEYDMTPDTKLGIGLYRLEKRALANGIQYVEGGATIDEVAHDLRKYIPLKDIDEIRKLLREATTKPFERAYMIVYGISDYEFCQLRQKFGNGMKNVLLRELVTKLRTRDQIMRPTLNFEPLLGYEVGS